MSDLYDDDILLWSERQSDLLRRIAAGEPVNERPDWVNIIEEVESVGRSDLRAVESLLLQALVHMLKAEGVAELALDVDNWRSDALVFRAQARRAFSPIHAAADRRGRHCMPMQCESCQQAWTADRRSRCRRPAR